MQLTLTATASDNVGVEHVAFFSRAPGDVAATQFADDSSAPYTAVYPSAGFGGSHDGAYEVWAKAYDAAGNSAVSTAGLTVDLTLPTVTISVAPRLTFEVAFPITVNASEPLLQIDLYDGDSLVASAYQPTLPRTLFETITRAHNGVRVFTVRVRDRAGNEAISAPDTVIVDIRWQWDTTPVIDRTSVLQAVAVRAGEVYAAGWQLPGWEGAADAVIHKVDSSGAVQWTRTFGTAGVSEMATSAAVDGSGNAYIAVWTIPSGSSDRDCFLVKYDAAGQEVWHRVIDSRDDEEFCHVAVDRRGSVYLAFARLPLLDSVTASASSPEAYLAKYDPDGTQVWLRAVTSLFSLSNHDLAGIAVDQSGDVYLTGMMRDTLNPLVGFSAFVLKVDGTGNELWKRLPGGYSARASVITVDSVGGIYAIGGNDGDLDSLAGVGGIYVVKYDASGATVWQRQLRLGDKVDSTAIVIIGAGIYVAGFSLGPFPQLYHDGQENIFLARVTGDGRLADLRTYGRQGWVEGSAVAADNAGAAYVAGELRSFRLGLLLKHRP